MLGEMRCDGELATAIVKGLPFVQLAAKFGKVDSIQAGADGIVFFDGSFSPTGVGGADLKIWFHVFHEAPAVRVEIGQLKVSGVALKPEAAENIVQIAMAMAGMLGFQLPSELNIIVKDGHVSIVYVLPFDFIKPLTLVTVEPEEGKAHGATNGLFIVRGTGPDVDKLFAFLAKLKADAAAAQIKALEQSNSMADQANAARLKAKPIAPNAPPVKGEQTTPYPTADLGDGKIKVNL